MLKSEALNSKTALEYLVMANDKSYSQIGRELNITPQQFSDWIKMRRPIPQERLNDLCGYFGIDEACLVDESHFAKALSPMTKIDIQTLLVKKAIEEGQEDSELYEAKLISLDKERAKQIRVGRLASILHRDNEQANQIVDAFLDHMESGNGGKLMSLMKNIKRPASPEEERS